MRRVLTCFLVAVFVVSAMMVSAATATAQSSRTCVYANDETDPNTVDGYLVTDTSQTYLLPVQTGGMSIGISAAKDIIVNPTKHILYAADSYSGDVAAMKIDPATCLLTLLGNYSIGKSNFGIGLATSPDGKRLYVAGVSSGALKLLDIQSDGGLSATKQKITLSESLSSVAVTPDGTTLIVAMPPEDKRGTTNEALSYSIAPSTGMLTLASTARTGGQPAGLSIDSQSKFVYAAEFGTNSYLRVGVLEVGPASTLTLTRVQNFNVMASEAGSTLVSANGKYLYVTNPEGASVSTLAINCTTGALRLVATASDGVAPYDQPIGLATTKDGAFIFTGETNPSGDVKLGIFAAENNGSLTSLGTFPLAQGGYTISAAWIAAVTF